VLSCKIRSLGPVAKCCGTRCPRKATRVCQAMMQMNKIDIKRPERRHTTQDKLLRSNGSRNERSPRTQQEEVNGLLRLAFKPEQARGGTIREVRRGPVQSSTTQHVRTARTRSSRTFDQMAREYPGKRVISKEIFCGRGNYVILHWPPGVARATGTRNWAGNGLFSCSTKEGKIVEHWDVPAGGARDPRATTIRCF